MRVVANGIAIRYELQGPEDAPVVTFSHSLAAGLEMWEPQVAALSDRYRVLRYDTRGHGGSEVPPGPYSLEMLAEDVAGLLDVLGIARTHFVGLSMGGMIGQALALGRPDLVDSLVLADTACQMWPELGSIWDARIETATRRGMVELVDGTIERWFTPPFLEDHRDLVEPIRMLVRTTPPTGFAGCCEAIRRLDYAGRLAEIGVPALVVVGEEDMGTPIAAAERIHTGIPGSRLVVLPSAAHLSNIEQAERFNAEVAGFLDGVVART